MGRDIFDEIFEEFLRKDALMTPEEREREMDELEQFRAVGPKFDDFFDNSFCYIEYSTEQHNGYFAECGKDYEQEQYDNLILAA